MWDMRGVWYQDKISFNSTNTLSVTVDLVNVQISHTCLCFVLLTVSNDIRKAENVKERHRWAQLVFLAYAKA
jgi:hypothetical protein